MKCELCGKREGLIKVQQIVGKKSLEIWLCDMCAEKHGIDPRNSKVEQNPNDLLSGLLDSPLERSEQEDENVCPNCSLSLKELKKIGRVGCPECFQTFSKEISSLLKNMSLKGQHRGKFPGRLMAYKNIFIDRENIKQRLRDALDTEDYERAAFLRDHLEQTDPYSGETHD